MLMLIRTVQFKARRLGGSVLIARSHHLSPSCPRGYSLPLVHYWGQPIQVPDYVARSNPTPSRVRLRHRRRRVTRHSFRLKPVYNSLATAPCDSLPLATILLAIDLFGENTDT
jgi:hypothetical protein